MLFSTKFFDFFEGYEDCALCGGNAATQFTAQDHQDFGDPGLRPGRQH